VKASTRVRFKRSDVEVTRLGMGTAPLGGLYAEVKGTDATGALERAWTAGIRYFDTAPMYGHGRAEHLTGDFLRTRDPSESFVISTKVGRVFANERPGRPLPPAALQNELDPGWHNALPFREVFDYSYDGIMRSFDDSQMRTGLPRFDILYVHDIGTLTHGDQHAGHWTALTVGGGFKALTELRQAGNIKAIGLGVNEWQVARDALEEVDLDCCMLAGRYTLLDQGAAEVFLPLALRRQVDIVAAGVFNSGILAGGKRARPKYDYADAPEHIILRVARIEAICASYEVPLPAAAMQYPMLHEAVTCTVIGAKTESQIATNVEWFEQPIPPALWDALRHEGLIG